MKRAFTLIEVLVVLGIIAVLLTMLLPALGSARVSARRVTCLSNLRQVGNALSFYAHENQGYWPVVQHFSQPEKPENWKSPVRDDRWQWFLLKYATPRAGDFRVERNDKVTGTGNIIEGPGMADFETTSLFCPAMAEFKDSLTSRVRAVQTGYGMQYMPLNSPAFPPVGMSDNEYFNEYDPDRKGKLWARIRPGGDGQYFKQSTWGRDGSQRIIIADARSYTLSVSPVPEDAIIPEQSFGFEDPGAFDQFDRYRHGLRTTKVMFNALFCDGHAASLMEIKDGYLGVRRRAVQ